MKPKTHDSFRRTSAIPAFVSMMAGFLFLFGNCSSDDSGGEAIPTEPGFTFVVSGAINKTISGTVVQFTESTVQGVDGKDIDTLFVVANADGGTELVDFGIAATGSVGTATHSVGPQLFPASGVF